MPKRRLTGIVVSNKMADTVAVKVERVKAHAKYKKRMKVHKNYLAQGRDLEIGDKVVIEECRPLSKRKNWKVIKQEKKEVKEV